MLGALGLGVAKLDYVDIVGAPLTGSLKIEHLDDLIDQPLPLILGLDVLVQTGRLNQVLDIRPADYNPTQHHHSLVNIRLNGHARHQRLEDGIGVGVNSR